MRGKRKPRPAVAGLQKFRSTNHNRSQREASGSDLLTWEKKHWQPIRLAMPRIRSLGPAAAESEHNGAFIFQQLSILLMNIVHS